MGSEFERKIGGNSSSRDTAEEQNGTGSEERRCDVEGGMCGRCGHGFEANGSCGYMTL